MSIRARIAAAVAVAATLTAMAPVAAFAATPATRPAVTYSLGAPSSNAPLTPGGKAETFVLTATNTTGKAQGFEPTFAAFGQGPVGLLRSDVELSAVPLHAPASTVSYGVQHESLFGGLSPKGGTLYRSEFTIPAHATYTWKFSIAAGRTWQANDSDIAFSLMDNSNPDSAINALRTFKVGGANTGGPVNLAYSGHKLVLDRFENVDITLTNHSGARLNLPVTNSLNFTAFTEAKNVVKPAAKTAEFQLLENGHWVTLGKDLVLPKLTGLANGASETYQLRVRLIGYETSIKGGTTEFTIGDIAWTPGRGAVARGSEALTLAKS
ncbi:hypothetical protein [Streptacidiphilus sp. P02-A3a]|uniref:hypothetical protein n=1 Tax=Streptacidiphilus sp. P02-A3a TaxID=2704468 RepID=UPI0015F98DBA|nr:hypothetical protein [Streptacidiphilus sp. P02-A3a]QMU67641.1 hypothetical protein GXP74_04765 [Streptacidiphilus sp. P02-A3a]